MRIKRPLCVLRFSKQGGAVPPYLFLKALQGPGFLQWLNITYVPYFTGIYHFFGSFPEW